MQRVVYTYRSSNGPEGDPPNLLARILAGAISVLVLVASAFLGVFIFLAVLGMLAVAGVVMAVRLWLYRRRVDAALKWGASQRTRKSDYIEAEYHEREDR
ncbi:MAG TPA: hypothetical protein PKE55_09815 [Kiritimatiellia bacterium]|nr:hypothetical protein [Kiritimatiellia bacterium]